MYLRTRSAGYSLAPGIGLVYRLWHGGATLRCTAVRQLTTLRGLRVKFAASKDGRLECDR